MAADWTFEPADLDRQDVASLITFHFARMRAHSPPDACHVLSVDALRDPALTLYALRDADGGLLGIGALRTLDAAHGELKSMRTHPDALGRGVGGTMLARLVEEARRRGMTRLSLETGSSPDFAGALRLYERDGFERSGPFGGYATSPFTRFYTRSI